MKAEGWRFKLSVALVGLSFLKKYCPPNKVSRLRHRIGLVMFCTPIVFGWGAVYSALVIPVLTRISMPYAATKAKEIR